MFLFRAIYTTLLFIATLLAAPFWMRKMKKRGGWGTGLIQRLAIHKPQSLHRFQSVDYYHAVSVGEVMIALKVIQACMEEAPDYKALIAVTTATGYQVAQAHSPDGVKLIYAPLDFPPLLHRVFTLLTPRSIILVDSELWPNLLHYTQRQGIPLKIINGRLSARSHARLLRVAPLVQPLLAHLQVVCVDGNSQKQRWQSLGIPAERILEVGSLKYDFSRHTPPRNHAYAAILDHFGPGLPVITLCSTHKGEEKHLTSSLQTLSLPHRLVIIPRHAERRHEITQDLQELGYEVTLKTSASFPTSPPSETEKPKAFIVDTTGELIHWLPFSTLVIIGKSWLKKGGQNPFESIMLGIPTLCGPHMQNFSPLITELVAAGGALQLSQADALPHTVEELLLSPQKAQKIGQTGRSLLETKTGAARKTAQYAIKP